MDRARIQAVLRKLPILKEPPVKGARDEKKAYQQFQHDIEATTWFRQGKESEEAAIDLIIRHSLDWNHLMDSQRIDEAGTLHYSEKKGDLPNLPNQSNYSAFSLTITRVGSEEYVVEREFSSLESQATIYYNPFGDDQ